MKTKDQIRKDAVREANPQQDAYRWNPYAYASMQIAGQRPQYINEIIERQEAQRGAEGKPFAALQKAKNVLTPS